MNRLITAAVVCAAMIPLANADEVILDDLIVNGSQCLGFDCVSGEVFEFDTLRLKENNTRIKFVDTSSSSSFPSNDWQITANDSNDGGQNKFSVEDLTGGTIPFTVLAGAPDDSLFVNDDGFIGLGTTTPAQNIHINAANAPSIRLEQNGSGGFTPRAWDISADEDNLIISTEGVTVLTLNSTGDLTIPGTLTAGTPGEDFPLPDYVFSPSHILMPLAQLKAFVTTNSHLPGIPSANQMETNGINMSELQLGLLKKVEELTLYTLQQQELITELQKQVLALKDSD